MTAGTSAVMLDERARHADEARDFMRKNPVGWICGSSSSGVGLRERRGVRVAREERRRDLVHARVGALRGEDRRDEQLEGVA